MSTAKISLVNVSKSYFSENEVTQALHKINLDFYFGEFAAITGESGGGKSTLLNVIGGMDNYDEGEMYVDGEATFQYDESEWEEYRRKKIGYIFQDYSLIGHYTVVDNIVCGLLAMGKDRIEAESLAEIYIEKVGLKGFETHPANELSSGQKQRLSIARALAKQTGVIIADEPTGNLDSETGLSIIKLLKEISKECLVIMVTHNYSQAEPYVTRKIRLHEGMIISDVKVGEEKQTVDITDSDDITEEYNDKKEVSANEKKAHSNKNIDFKYASFFARLNLKTQRAKAILFTFFLFIISTVSFVLIGEICVKSDDIFTKDYEDSAFARKDDKRIVVKKKNGKNITSQDIDKIKKVRYVNHVDSCDYANDINYYIFQDVDYEIKYGQRIEEREMTGSGSVSFTNHDKFMSSVDCIDKSDLKNGTLPKERNDIVLYSEDESIIGKTYKCYFSAANIWDANDYCMAEVTVTGILKDETKQVYFSKELCNMLSMKLDSGEFRLLYEYDHSMGDYKVKRLLIPIINNDLKGNEVQLSKNLGEDGPASGEYTLRFQQLDENGDEEGRYVEQQIDILEQKSDSSRNFIEVSSELYNKYYKAECRQSSVYIDSYAKTDKVMKKLNKIGYYAISTYRAGATIDNETKANQRLVIMGICVAGLLVMFIAEFFILRAMMSIKIKEYLVLKFIGMKISILRMISYIEMGIYCGIAVIITFILMAVLRMCGIDFITDIAWYYTFVGYLCFILYNAFVCFMTVTGFNHLLKGRLRQ